MALRPVTVKRCVPLVSTRPLSIVRITKSRRFSTITPSQKPKASSNSPWNLVVFPNVHADVSSKWVIGIGALSFGLGAIQHMFGSSEHIFHRTFITDKDPDDLAEFYGNEDFMEIFSVFPFVVEFMMRGGYFDDRGHVITYGFPGPLEVSMEFEEKEVNDKVVWFNKRERFQDHSFGITWWDITQNFGFNKRKDGTCEIYHHGEHFSGPFFIRIIFDLHSRYVIWATEKHVNSNAFGSEELEDERMVQQKNVLNHVFKGYLHSLAKDVQHARADLEKSRHALRVKVAAGLLQDSELSDLYEKKIQQHDETIQKLKMASLKRHNTRVEVMDLGPRRRTRRSLKVDDAETELTIQEAMQHIEDAGESTSTSLRNLVAAAEESEDSEIDEESDGMDEDTAPDADQESVDDIHKIIQVDGYTEALKDVRNKILSKVLVISDEEAKEAACNVMFATDGSGEIFEDLKHIDETLEECSGHMVGSSFTPADTWAFLATADIPVEGWLDKLPKLKAVVAKVTAELRQSSLGASGAGDLLAPAQSSDSGNMEIITK